MLTVRDDAGSGPSQLYIQDYYMCILIYLFTNFQDREEVKEVNMLLIVRDDDGNGMSTPATAQKPYTERWALCRSGCRG